jgi:hypothetical protein
MPEIIMPEGEMLKALRNSYKELKEEVDQLKIRMDRLEAGSDRPHKEPYRAFPKNIFSKRYPTEAMRETYRKHLGQYPPEDMSYEQVWQAIQESYKRAWSSRNGDKRPGNPGEGEHM